MQVGNLIRVPVSVPAGQYDRFRARTAGSAFFKGVNDVHTIVNGQPKIGAVEKEFDLVVTDRGMIAVEIEIRSSQPGPMPIKVTVEFKAQ